MNRRPPTLAEVPNLIQPFEYESRWLSEQLASLLPLLNSVTEIDEFIFDESEVAFFEGEAPLPSELVYGNEKVRFYRGREIRQRIIQGGVVALSNIDIRITPLAILANKMESHFGEQFIFDLIVGNQLRPVFSKSSVFELKKLPVDAGERIELAVSKVDENKDMRPRRKNISLPDQIKYNAIDGADCLEWNSTPFLEHEPLPAISLSSGSRKLNIGKEHFEFVEHFAEFSSFKLNELKYRSKQARTANSIAKYLVREGFLRISGC